MTMTSYDLGTRVQYRYQDGVRGTIVEPSRSTDTYFATRYQLIELDEGSTLHGHGPEGRFWWLDSPAEWEQCRSVGDPQVLMNEALSALARTEAAIDSFRMTTGQSRAFLGTKSKTGAAKVLATQATNLIVRSL
jgi:hypothetical protein